LWRHGALPGHTHPVDRAASPLCPPAPPAPQKPLETYTDELDVLLRMSKEEVVSPLCSEHTGARAPARRPQPAHARTGGGAGARVLTTYPFGLAPTCPLSKANSAQGQPWPAHAPMHTCCKPTNTQHLHKFASTHARTLRTHALTHTPRTRTHAHTQARTHPTHARTHARTRRWRC